MCIYIEIHTCIFARVCVYIYIYIYYNMYIYGPYLRVWSSGFNVGLGLRVSGDFGRRVGFVALQGVPGLLFPKAPCTHIVGT